MCQCQRLRPSSITSLVSYWSVYYSHCNKTQLGRFELTSLMSEPVLQGDVFLMQFCIYRGQRVNVTWLRQGSCSASTSLVFIFFLHFLIWSAASASKGLLLVCYMLQQASKMAPCVPNPACWPYLFDPFSASIYIEYIGQWWLFGPHTSIFELS